MYHSPCIAVSSCLWASHISRLLCVQKCQEEFQQNWQQYAHQERINALGKPLPRNWVPYTDPIKQGMLYLNMRSNELHRINPNLVLLKPDLEEQWAEGQQQLHSALERIWLQQQLVQEAARRVQDDLHAKMHDLRFKHAAHQ